MDGNTSRIYWEYDSDLWCTAACQQKSLEYWQSILWAIKNNYSSLCYCLYCFHWWQLLQFLKQDWDLRFCHDKYSVGSCAVTPSIPQSQEFGHGVGSSWLYNCLERYDISYFLEINFVTGGVLLNMVNIPRNIKSLLRKSPVLSIWRFNTSAAVYACISWYLIPWLCQWLI